MADTTITVALDGEVLYTKIYTEQEHGFIFDGSVSQEALIPWSVEFEPDSDAIAVVEMSP